MKNLLAFVALMALVGTLFAQSPIFDSRTYRSSVPTNVLAHPQLSGNQVVYSVTAFNHHTADLYLMVFNTNSTPATGWTPELPPVRIPANSTGGYDMDSSGVNFGVGVSVAASATPITFTNSGNYFLISVTTRAK